MEKIVNNNIYILDKKKDKNLKKYYNKEFELD